MRYKEFKPLNETARDSQILNYIAEFVTEKLFGEYKIDDLILDPKSEPVPRASRLLSGRGVTLKNLGVPHSKDPIINDLLSHIAIRLVTDPSKLDHNINPQASGAYNIDIYSIELYLSSTVFQKASSTEDRIKIIKTTLVHELTHALDDLKSEGFYNKKSANFQGDYRAYLAQPHEINARFQEALLDIANHIKQNTNFRQAELPQLIQWAFKDAELSSVLPASSKQYKRLLSRTYAFFVAELNRPIRLIDKANWTVDALSKLGVSDKEFA